MAMFTSATIPAYVLSKIKKNITLVNSSCTILGWVWLEGSDLHASVSTTFGYSMTLIHKFYKQFS